MKVTVHIGFEQKDLEKLDAWGKARRLTRGAAIMTLYEMATGDAPSPAKERVVVTEEDDAPH